MKESKLAIVIPFYKIDFFEDTLKSLALQTNQGFNVYIGNDGSPDDPQELIKKYDRQDNFHYKRFEENFGGKGKLSEQWERCIDLSRDEDWIMILADDDYLSTNFVDVLYKNLHTAEKEKTTLLRFKMRRVSENNEFLIDLEQPVLQTGKDYVWEDETKKRFISISENVFSRKVYNEKKFRKYPLAWRVPMMMYMDFTNNGNVLGINDAHIHIRRSSQQLTRRHDMDNYKRQAMELFYHDIIKEYEHAFHNFQNLQFLKVYNFYRSGRSRLPRPIYQYYKKYGGISEVIKYFIKKLIKR
ncbi:glycosyltransferase family 2 protein [Epilithonimonas sp.]|uniref:glycosyltransferase family 2 protein n=1 Tax=Epilithonimonas sp. TaxID=2894511 RepID=UPI00289D3EBE|nr:glycosyltransferase family 2 protein [Epilithonimonas sp.]